MYHDISRYYLPIPFRNIESNKNHPPQTCRHTLPYLGFLDLQQLRALTEDRKSTGMLPATTMAS